MSVNGGDNSRAPLNPSGHGGPSPENSRRRRGKGGGYYNNGPRDNRMSTGYWSENSRMPHRGGSGDGPHNGYRGVGSEYENSQQQQQPYMNQCQPSSDQSHSRSSHHQPPTMSHHHNNHHNSHYHNHPHNKGPRSSSNGRQSDNIGIDYEAGSRQQRSGGMANSALPSTPAASASHHMDPRNVPQQQHENNCGPLLPPPPPLPPPQMLSHPPPGFGPVNNGDIIVISQEQAVQFANGGPSGMQQLGGHFHAPHPPLPYPPPSSVNVFGCHPNSQPLYGTLALCHIPFGINPSLVISPVVHTQIIGSGVMTPGLPYNIPAPSPIVPTHPILFQNTQQQHEFQQHHHHHHQMPLSGNMPAPPQPGSGNGGDCLVYVDSSSLLNPDADAFFPPAFPPANEDDGARNDNTVDVIDEDEILDVVSVNIVDEIKPTMEPVSPQSLPEDANADDSIVNETDEIDVEKD